MNLRINDLVEFRGKQARVFYIYDDEKHYDIQLTSVFVTYEKIHISELNLIQ